MNKLQVATLSAAAGVLAGTFLAPVSEENVSEVLAQAESIVFDSSDLIQNAEYLRSCDKHNDCNHIGSIKSDWYKTTFVADHPVIKETMQVLGTEICPFVTVAQTFNYSSNNYSSNSWSLVESTIQTLNSDFNVEISVGEYSGMEGYDYPEPGMIDVFCTKLPRPMAFG